MYGAVSAKVAEEMRKPDVSDFFARLIQRTSPKSYAQALGELVVTRRFFENFSGDQVRVCVLMQLDEHGRWRLCLWWWWCKGGALEGGGASRQREGGGGAKLLAPGWKEGRWGISEHC